MNDWLKECEICNTGLCKEMAYLTDSVEKGGVGLSVREAAKRLEAQAVEEIGEKVWTAEQIRNRYLYHTGQTKPGRKSTTPKKEVSGVVQGDPVPATSLDMEPVHLPVPTPTMEAESPAAVDHDAPLIERDKEAFLELIKRFHIELVEATGLRERSSRVERCNYTIYRTSEHSKDDRRDIRIKKNKFDAVMKKHRQPIEVRIISALINLQEDLSRIDNSIALHVPVPDEIYNKCKAELDKKQAIKDAKRKEKGG